VKSIKNCPAFILAALLGVACVTACQRAAESGTGNSNSGNRPANNTATQNTANTGQPSAATTDESQPQAGSLATPTDAYKFGYTARQKKDLAGLKRVLSKEALDFLTEVGKEEKKTLDDQLRALAERPQAATAETRNEKISGDTATLEYLNERGTWSTMAFVKEGSDWKIGLPKAG
jgi:hypothetical protein